MIGTRHLIPLVLFLQVFCALSIRADESLTIEFKAKGVVCAMCVQSLRRHLLTEPGVREVRIDIKTRRVTLQVEEGRAPSQERLRQLAEESGFGFEGPSGG